MSTTLKSLMENYFDNSTTRKVRPAFLKEIKGTHDLDLPITADKSSWVVSSDPERLMRIFEFPSIDLRNYFLSELLAYEQEFAHYAKICAEGTEVIIEVYTHDLMRVTELDKEYANQCDVIFEDLKLWGPNHDE